MIIAQRGTSFDAATTFTNTDGNYTLDRFKVIDSRAGSDVVDITQTTLASELPAGARAAMKLVHQRQNEQAGIVQYIDYDTTRLLLDKDTSLSFEIYNSDSVTRNFRAAIVSWQGAVDDMPNDPISTWQTAANLGFATNFTTENTTTALTANATSWNRFTINGVNIDTANTNNLAIVIWTDESMANGYEWRVTKAKLEKSSIATAWKTKSFAVELANCENVLKLRSSSGLYASGHTNSTTNAQLGYYYTLMSRTPTVALNGTWQLEYRDIDVPSSAITAIEIKKDKFTIDIDLTGIFTPAVGEGCSLQGQDSSSYILVTSEL
jgi:hypothetical protein